MSKEEGEEREEEDESGRESTAATVSGDGGEHLSRRDALAAATHTRQQDNRTTAGGCG